MKKTKPKPAELRKEPKSGCYFFKAFRKYKAVACFSSRRFRINFMPGTNSSVTIGHRRAFCRTAGMPLENVVCLEQVHGANIVRVGSSDRGKGTRSDENAIKGTDAALTDVKGVGLVTRTADCAPLFILDPRHEAIGMAHVGWRGASERLTSKVIQAFRRQFLSKPGDLIVAIGPMIRSCCYEVGPEFRDVFGPFISKREASYYFDLTGWILEELRSEGIGRSQIRDCLFCTSCRNDEFPSHRKEGAAVRHMWSLLSLKVERGKRHASK